MKLHLVRFVCEKHAISLVYVVDGLKTAQIICGLSPEVPRMNYLLAHFQIMQTEAHDDGVVALPIHIQSSFGLSMGTPRLPM